MFRARAAVLRSAAAVPLLTLRARRAGNLATKFALNVGSARDAQDVVLAFGVNAAVPAHVRPLAVVKVGGDIITHDAENLTSSLSFLRSCGIQPVVVHGGGPQLNDGKG